VKIYENPGGFAVVVLYEEEDGSSDRIHAWGDHVPDTIDWHMHRAAIERSEVLEGSVNEQRCTYADDPDGDWERLTADCVGADGTGEYKVEILAKTRCRIDVYDVRHHKAGDTYSLPADVLHRVFPVRLPAVTRVRFGPVTNRVHTIVRRYDAAVNPSASSAGTGESP
jgi:hypothetical protein